MSAGLALVLAGGGERAVAWELGVLAGLADAGLDLTSAESVIGTSAGALVGAHIAVGADPFETACAICAADRLPDAADSDPSPSGRTALNAERARLDRPSRKPSAPGSPPERQVTTSSAGGSAPSP